MTLAKLTRVTSAFALAAAIALSAKHPEAPAVTRAPLRAASYSTAFLNAEAMDACGQYSAANWNKAYSALTNLWGAGFYLGGLTADSAGCYEPDKTWVNNLAVGYRLIPIWDGYQAPCAGLSHPMSSDPDTAENQGHNAANNAIAAAKAVGLTSGNAIYYDMESYPSGCEGPVKRYIDGWVDTLQSQGWVAGLYANICNQPIDDYWGIAAPPSDVWIAQWNGNDTSGGVNTSCLSGSHWPSKRIHQYQSSAHVTAGGADIVADKDCVDGQVDSQVGSLNNQCGWT